MKLFAGVWLVGIWGLWLAATAGGMDGLAGWVFVAAYLGVAVGLFVGSRPFEAGILRLVLQLIAAGFAFLTLGEMGWLTLFKDGSAGGNVILPNLPYYASDIFFAYAGIRFLSSAEQLFGFSRGWLYGSGVVSILMIAAISFGSYKPDLGFWTDTLDNVVNAVASLSFMVLGYVTRGGIWSRWTLPASIGFGFRLAGNIYYTFTADTYAYGSPADWLWLVGTSVLYIFLFQPELQLGSQGEYEEEVEDEYEEEVEAEAVGA